MDLDGIQDNVNCITSDISDIKYMIDKEDHPLMLEIESLMASLDSFNKALDYEKSELV